MSYLDPIAREIAARVGDDLLPEGDTERLFRIYAVLARAKGADVGPEDVHDAWAAWMQERDPGHPAIRPYSELDAPTQAADLPYVEAIRAVAAGRG
jgi:hypothetical protein